MPYLLSLPSPRLTSIARLGATPELSEDLSALLEADDAVACENRFAALVATELAGVRDERGKGWSGEDPADGDVAP